MNCASPDLWEPRGSNAPGPPGMDPLVIVRRSFLLDTGGSVKAETLGEFAILLTMEASKRNLTVGYV